FVIWKDEALKIWSRGWAQLYSEDDSSRTLLQEKALTIVIIATAYTELEPAFANIVISACSFILKGPGFNENDHLILGTFKGVKPIYNVVRTGICESTDKTRSMNVSRWYVEGTEPLVCYAQGKEVKGDVAKFSKVTYVHEKCIAWLAGYFSMLRTFVMDLDVINANSLFGGIYKLPLQLQDEFLLLCPKHESQKFPSDVEDESSEARLSKKYSLVDFARGNGAVVSKYWRKEVTHVIAATDLPGACTRTLKVLLAILNGKWILTTERLQACAKAGKLVDEEPYEVFLDTHGASGGPKAGRLRVLNNRPKLFNNLKFYFIGDFVQAFKADLLNLVTTVGGTIADTKMELISSSNDANAEAKPNVNQVTVVVYNADYSNTYGFEDEASMKYQCDAVASKVTDSLFTNDG
ncbi:BRCA1-associated RING domain protein 1 isoform X1, partial [Tanacetum coccineum]